MTQIQLRPPTANVEDVFPITRQPAVIGTKTDEWIAQNPELVVEGSFWVIGVLCVVVAALAAFIVAAARWATIKLVARLDHQDEMMAKIHDVVSDEVKLLQIAQHQSEVRLAILEEFKEQFQNRFRNYGRRITDQQFDEDPK